VFKTSKVVWKEGLFLQPQHLQQAERSLQAALSARLAAHHPHAYGITEMALDDDALANGLCTVLTLRGVLPDGTVVDAPSQDPVPAPRSFAAAFPVSRESLDVHIALPVVVEGRPNVESGQAEGAGPARYRSRTLEVADEALGRGRKEIEVGEPGYVLRFGGEPLDSYCAMRIARIVRRADGRPALDPQCVPPLLRFGASPGLLAQVQATLQLLMGRITALSQGRRQVAGGLAAFPAGEENAFRLLQTLNTYTPMLAHHHLAPSAHPYDVYCLLNQFCGALCTFSADMSIADLPRYDHEDLGAVFAGLLGAVRAILGTEITSACVTLPVEQAGRATYVCRVSDPRLLSQARLFLGVSAAVPEKELIVGVLQRIKMASRERLDVLVSSALPGLQLMHVSRPPEGLPTRPSYIYFGLNQQGEIWEGVRTSGTLACYFPADYQGLKLEVLALRS